METFAKLTPSANRRSCVCTGWISPMTNRFMGKARSINTDPSLTGRSTGCQIRDRRLSIRPWPCGPDPQAVSCNRLRAAHNGRIRAVIAAPEHEWRSEQLGGLQASCWMGLMTDSWRTFGKCVAI
ncbi:hypothetical protein SRHO_G00239270 [Serrasalmus rhombeus]